MEGLVFPWLMAAWLAGAPAVTSGKESVGEGLAGADTTDNGGESRSPTDEILRSLPDPELRRIVADALERNPALAAAEAEARAAAARIPQAGALPDPTATVTAYLLTPETRVGPQRLMVMLSQKLPWLGKLRLREQASLLAAAAAEAEVEATRLDLVTQVRRLHYELGFLDSLYRATEIDLDTLRHFEELARARYESGVGIEQGVIKLQAEITREETELLRIAGNRAALVSAINALRDRPGRTAIPEAELPQPREMMQQPSELRSMALRRHPSLAVADAEIARATIDLELARKEYKPDVSLGLTYGAVERRDDPAARASPPPDDGQDVLGLSAMVNLPIWRRRLESGIVEATEEELRQAERKRLAMTKIDRSITELTARLPLLWRQLRLFRNVLSIQAEESLNSAEAAYSSGSINALDLLDAERVLLEVRIGTERTRADYAIRVAELEGAVAGPLDPGETREESVR